MDVQHIDSSERDFTAAEADARVAAWKLAWLEGAKAAWGPESRSTNPYSDALQSSAWTAGWNWAGQNPDRRSKQPERIAHPHRRSTDSNFPRNLKRAAAVGATGVTLFAISRAVRWLFRPRILHPGGTAIATRAPREH
jgi:hypothetical protein